MEIRRLRQAAAVDAEELVDAREGIGARDRIGAALLGEPGRQRIADRLDDDLRRPGQRVGERQSGTGRRGEAKAQATLLHDAEVDRFDAEVVAADIATFPPYNEHLTHDAGAFLTGLGVAALAGLLLSDALAAVLAGVAAGSLLHGVSHILDHDLGGRSSDPWTVSVFGLLTLAGFVAAVATRRARS